MSVRYKLVIDHDERPDMSWLDQDMYNPSHKDYEPVYRMRADMKAGRKPIDGDWYRDPANHVALAMVLYVMGPTDTDWEHKASLVGIDFLADEDNWQTGTFYKLSDLKPRSCLRQLARDMGMK